MKTLNNKKLKLKFNILQQEIQNGEINIQKTTKDCSYKDLIRTCADFIPQGGLNVSEQKLRMRIISVLDKKEEAMKFEDSDFTLIHQLVDSMKWNLVSPEIIALTDEIGEIQNKK